MPRTFIGPLLQALGLAAFAGATFGAYQAVYQVVKADPLAEFRPKNNPFTQNEGVIIEGAFPIRSYIGERLVTKANVAKATVRSDRSVIDLEGIEDGVFYADDGQTFRFATAKATYGTYTKSVVADQGVRVWNANLDLRAQGFKYDHVVRRLAVNGPVSGTIAKGQAKAQDVVIDLAANVLTTGPIEWAGPLQVEGRPRTPWRVQAARTTIRQDIMVYTDARGEDRETIVRARTMTYDRANDVVTAEGDVLYFGVDANIAADKIVIERKTGKATITGRIVRMLVKPESQPPAETAVPPVTPLVPRELAESRPQPGSTPQEDAQRQQEEELRSPDNLRQYPIVITATRIEYWFRRGERRAIVTGDPFARQELPGMRWRELFADRAVYDGENDTLTLTSRTGRAVRMRNSIGDDLTATSLTVSTRRDDDSLEAEGVQGTVMVDDNERPDRQNNAAGSTGGTNNSPTRRRDPANPPPSLSGPIQP